MDIKNYIHKIAEYLVDDVDSINVFVGEGRKLTTIELEVAEEDTGKVIGVGGATANAIRAILGAIGAKQDKQYILQILDK